MRIWSEPLTRENFADFFQMYAPSAYRSTYQVLGDSTRTEAALTDAFLSVYQQKANIDDPEELVFLFSDILQERVETLVAEYPIAETNQRTNRQLDEFTSSAILSEIYRRIDSTSFKVVEFLTTGSSGKSSQKLEIVLGQTRKAGLSLFLLLQLLLVAVIVFFLTQTAFKLFAQPDTPLPENPKKIETPLDERFVAALDYLPLNIPGIAYETTAPNPSEGEGAVESGETTVSSESSSETQPTDTASADAGATNSTTSSTSETAETKAVLAASRKNTDLINFEKDTCSLKYLRYELGEDASGEPALVVYFTFTNKDTANSHTALYEFSVKAVQNRVSCDTATMENASTELNNTSTPVAPGQSQTVAYAFQLLDKTIDVDLEVNTSLSSKISESQIQLLTIAQP